jgi:subtilisin family serine protease
MLTSGPGTSRSLAAARAAVLAGLVAGALVGVTTSVSAAPAEGTVHLAAGSTPIAGNYIVVLKTDRSLSATRSRSRTDGLAAKYGAALRHRYPAIQGFSARMTAQHARQLAANPAVALVEQDSVVTLAATQNGATWGLDRVDQRNLPLSSTYTYNTTASNVTAYVIDTGVKTAHNEFGGRAAVSYDALGGNGQDCNGHGTHVAGTIGGSTYGLAKGVRIRAVRVLDCGGSGSNAGVIAGIDWVTSNHAANSVANMSLGGGVSSALDTAVRRSVTSGVTYALAAGNSNANACNSSPSRVTEAITVGATTSGDARASFSNYGTCLDIFAPGASITSAWYSSNTATNTISGTSMAAPHVAGAAALYLGLHPGSSPTTVRNALVNTATSGVVGSPGSGSPNLLLYTLSL